MPDDAWVDAFSQTLFKSTARALSMAVALDPRVGGVPSTKGSL